MTLSLRKRWPKMEEKARRYVHNQLIRRVPEGWLVLHLKGTHEDHLVQLGENGFVCDCQGFKFRGLCSHVLAVQIYLKEGYRVRT